jgi:hypothetical protein
MESPRNDRNDGDARAFIKSECPELDDLRVAPGCVHLILHVRGDWEAGRGERVAEAERRTAAATRWAQSASFRSHFERRIGVLRMQTDGPVPSIVASVFAESGIEVEDLSLAPASDGPTCVSCGRSQLREEQAAMSDDGWNCPACLRAWNVRAQPSLGKPARRFFIPARVLYPLLLILGLLFIYAVGNELRYLSNMNRIIRAHMPN